MIELSLHILDIAENSIRAGARTVHISIDERSADDTLTLEIGDNGRGMDAVAMKKALDPFYTTKKVRRVGLGLPMLAEAARRTGGVFRMTSEEGKGTTVKAVFGLNHIDRQPLGDVSGTLTILIAGNPDVDFIYKHQQDGKTYVLDTRDIKKEIDDIPINHIDVLRFVREHIQEGLKDIHAQA